MFIRREKIVSAYLIDAVRTPIGRYGGSLSGGSFDISRYCTQLSSVGQSMSARGVLGMLDTPNHERQNLHGCLTNLTFI